MVRRAEEVKAGHPENGRAATASGSKSNHRWLCQSTRAFDGGPAPSPRRGESPTGRSSPSAAGSEHLAASEVAESGLWRPQPRQLGQQEPYDAQALEENAWTAASHSPHEARPRTRTKLSAPR